MSDFDINELAKTIVHQAHSIRLLEGELDRLNAELDLAKRAAAPHDEPGPVSAEEQPLP